MGQSEKANAIEKALEVLLAFAPHNQELGTTELSEKLNFHKATASRILLTLTDYGFLQQNPTTKKFSLGRSIHMLGTALTASLANNFIQIAKPHVDALRNQLDEAVGLEFWADGGSTWAYSTESSRPITVGGRPGRRLPFYAAAGAKAILAFRPEHEVETLLQQPLAALTPATMTDPHCLRQQLAEIRAQGFAIDREELRTGICAVGAPIFQHDGTAFAAVVVIIPTQHLIVTAEAPLVVALQQSAAAISTHYFYNKE
ncbi:MAG: IclR family transcriptional regulator [Caldilineaceae bacterium]